MASLSYVNTGHFVRETNFANLVILLVESFPLILGRFLGRFLCILMDFSIQIATIRMGLSIVYVIYMHFLIIFSFLILYLS